MSNLQNTPFGKKKIYIYENKVLIFLHGGLQVRIRNKAVYQTIAQVKWTCGHKLRKYQDCIKHYDLQRKTY